MGQTPPSNTGTYIYCVARAQPFEKGEPPFATPGIGGREKAVRIVQHGDLVAVVSDAPQDDYDVNRENVGAPDELHRSLAEVRERIELELKVLWNEERLFAEIMAENDDIRVLRDRLAGQPPQATYYERIELGERVAAAIQRKSEAEGAALLDAIEPLAVETSVNTNLSDMMLLNAAFLVDKSQEQAFDARVQELGEARAGRQVFQYVGPLPPYNFVDIRLHLEEEPDGSAV